ncbi:MAG: hypothetical protein NZ518_00065 [Dehalococcoidia bacterium]|nr:hypothetical protein [Dehalococcoidia bacterium]
MPRYLDIIGTVFSRFRLGLTGPYVKNESGSIAARNSQDNAYAAIRAALAQIYGDDIELNAGASGSGANRRMTLRRPSTGMARDITIVFPAGDPAPNQAVTVASFNSTTGVVELSYTTIASGDDKIVVDTTTLSHGSSSPVSMFTKPANAVILKVEVIIDTAFNGSPSLSVGISGDTSKYMASTHVDLTAPAETVFEVAPGKPASGSEAIIATYAAGGATAGSARILTHYVIPS